MFGDRADMVAIAEQRLELLKAKGFENASRLHYFHVEGDSAHRLQNCDECGQCQRMYFQEGLTVPFSMEVEDMVMAKLDAVALDPRFRAE